VLPVGQINLEESVEQTTLGGLPGAVQWLHYQYYPGISLVQVCRHLSHIQSWYGAFIRKRGCSFNRVVFLEPQTGQLVEAGDGSLGDWDISHLRYFPSQHLGPSSSIEKVLALDSSLTDQNALCDTEKHRTPPQKLTFL
jgi:hypothetical protein